MSCDDDDAGSLASLLLYLRGNSAGIQRVGVEYEFVCNGEVEAEMSLLSAAPSFP